MVMAKIDKELLNALIMEDSAAIKVALDNGANPNQYAGTKSLLTIAQDNGDYDSMAVLMRGGANPTEALHMAAYFRRFDAFKVLMSNGADINTRNKLGQTALLISVMKNQLDVVKFLLKEGADINSLDKHGNSPLYYALGSNVSDTLNFLIRKGAKIDVINKNGESVIDVASVFYPKAHSIILNHLLQEAAKSPPKTEHELPTNSIKRARI